MCKIYKFSERTESKTNPYVFRSFNLPFEEQVDTNLEVSELYSNGIERLEEKIQSLKEQADSIIKMAEEEASKILETANHEAKSILNASSMEGYKEGLTIANKKTEEIIQSTHVKAMEILENTKLSTEKTIRDLEDEVLDFSFDIAKKILDVELDRNDEVFASIINKALLKIKTDTEAKIVMQAEDLKRLEDNGIDKVYTDGGKLALQFISDKEGSTGDIIIESARGTVDAGVNSQFKKIRNSFVHENSSAI